MPVRPSSISSSSSSAATTLAALRSWAETTNLKSSALAVPRTQAPTTGPVAVQRAYVLYRTWEERDLGSVRLLRADVDGKQAWGVHTTTDGDACFLELFNGRGSLLASGVIDGAGAVTWDAAPGAVRDRVASPGSSPTVTAFHDAVLEAQRPATASADKIVADEMRQAARSLIGAELTTASVDGVEAAALARVLADAHELTPAARAFALRLGDLYVGGAPKELRRQTMKPLASLTLTATTFAAGASLSTAEVKGRADAPRLQAFSALVRAAHGWLPTQLVPVTRTAAIDALRAAGATGAEARAAVEALSVDDALLYLGKVFQHDASSSTSVPTPKGIGVFSATADGKRVSAVVVPQLEVVPAAPRAAIHSLTGVDRAIDVVTPVGGNAFDLEWRPSSGGVLQARLDLSDTAAPTIASANVPVVLERGLRDLLAQHVAQALGHGVDVLGWVGRDNAQGPGFIVAHKPAGGGGPTELATVRIALGGAATVTSKRIGTSAEDAQLARDLAIVLARAHAHDMVDDPAINDDARLEVALRTGWRQAPELELQDASSSPVGFTPASERVQLMLPRVWGDNAVIVTFANNGTLRIEAVN